MASGEADIGMHFVGPLLIASGCRRPGRDPGRRSTSGCLELFGTRARSGRSGTSRARPCRVAALTARSPARLPRDHRWPTSGSTRARTSTGSPYPLPRRCELLRRRQGGRVHRLPARRRRSCGPRRSATWWSTARWTGPGPSTSAACVAGQPGVRAEEPGGDEASAAGDPEGRGHLRARAGAGGRACWSTRGSRPALRLRAPDA